MADPIILSGAPTTLQRQKIFLGIGHDRQDGLLTLLINQATGIIERYIKRTIKSATYTDEVYAGQGERTLVLKQWPLTSVSAVKEAENAVSSSPTFSTLDSTTYRFWNDGRIERLDGEWLHGFQYKITYVAGYLIDFTQENTPASHTLPPALEIACTQLVSRLYNERRAGGFQQTSQGDSSVSFRADAIDPVVKNILDQYTNPTI